MSYVTGADELIRDINKLGADMPKTERQMLKAGGQVMAKDGWRAEIIDRDLVSHTKKNTDHMRDHITAKIISRRGRMRAEITATGEDARGVRHAEKAFYLHYGTSRIPATRWIDAAEERAMDDASAAMRAVLDDAIRKTVGGK